MTRFDALMKELKDAYEIESGERIDFRKHVFLDNQYGGTPCFNYNFAESVVVFTYAFLEKHIEENKYDYPMFGGWKYNLMMECEKLRSTTLQNFISGNIQGMLNYRGYTE